MERRTAGKPCWSVSEQPGGAGLWCRTTTAVELEWADGGPERAEGGPERAEGGPEWSSVIPE